MTLTFKLIRDIIKANASNKFWVPTSNGSVVRALTDRHTHRDGTNSIPTTADTGGNESVVDIRCQNNDNLKLIDSDHIILITHVLSDFIQVSLLIQDPDTKVKDHNHWNKGPCHYSKAGVILCKMVTEMCRYSGNYLILD